VHIFGYPAELAELEAIATRHGLALVEDACEALGSEYRGRPVGSSGHPAVFAFYPNKQMTTGEGGAVAVGSEEEWELLKSLSNQGRSDSGEWLTHSRLGYNYRLDDLSAALGLAQLERYDGILAARAEVAGRYGELLSGLDRVESPLADDADHRRSWFVYVVKLAAGIDRNGVIGRLAADGVASKPYLPSIHLQPYYRERFGYREGMLPVAEDASARTLALPFHSRLALDEQERVVEALALALG
jgi:perosamine synthetase